jgi:CheY-like chemotaxis protein
MSRHLIVCTGNPTLVDAVSQASEGEARITVSESGLQVLATVDVIHADLLVLDLETPGINPLLLTSAIRALAPALPILAVSAHPPEDGRDLSHKGVSFVTLPADQRAWGQVLGTSLEDLAPSDRMDRVSLPSAAAAR